MPQIQYSVKYRKNEGLVLTPEELLALHFYGIPMRSKDGTTLSPDTVRFQIKAAQQEIEKYLEIRLNITLIDQTIDYFRDDYWNKFPIMKTKLPVKQPLSLMGFLNGVEQIRYPREWMNVKRDSEGHYFKKINIIPTGAITGTSGSVLLSGITAYYGLTAYNDIPNYFSCQYITGYDSDHIPFDVLDLVSKLAAIKLFAVLGELPLGAGISSISLGIDGLSQSLSSTKSGQTSAYSARINQYLKDVEEHSKRLKMFYKSFNFAAF